MYSLVALNYNSHTGHPELSIFRIRREVSIKFIERLWGVVYLTEQDGSELPLHVTQIETSCMKDGGVPISIHDAYFQVCTYSAPTVL